MNELITKRVMLLNEVTHWRISLVWAVRYVLQTASPYSMPEAALLVDVNALLNKPASLLDVRGTLEEMRRNGAVKSEPGDGGAKWAFARIPETASPAAERRAA